MMIIKFKIIPKTNPRRLSPTMGVILSYLVDRSLSNNHFSEKCVASRSLRAVPKHMTLVLLTTHSTDRYVIDLKLLVFE